MAHFNFVISQNAKWGHAGFYIDCHRMTVPENILLQKSTECNTRGRPSTRFVDHTNTLGGERTFPWERTFLLKYFPLGHFPDTRVRRDTTRSANAALDIGEPIN